MMNAHRFTPVDSTLIPTGELQNVNGTPLDFTKPMAIGAKIHAENEQLKHAEPRQGGYDFNWVLNNPADLYALAVRITDFLQPRRGSNDCQPSLSIRASRLRKMLLNSVSFVRC
jgi:hypothetical protein